MARNRRAHRLDGTAHTPEIRWRPYAPGERLRMAARPQAVRGGCRPDHAATKGTVAWTWWRPRAGETPGRPRRSARTPDSSGPGVAAGAGPSAGTARPEQCGHS